MRLVERLVDAEIEIEKLRTEVAHLWEDCQDAYERGWEAAMVAVQEESR
jgi:hypothetical protein